MKGWTPYDPSLKIVHRYAPDQIGARIQDTVREAEPDLAAAGCDVADLL